MKILFVILFIILPFNLNAKENNIIYEVYVPKIISDNIQKIITKRLEFIFGVKLSVESENDKLEKTRILLRWKGENIVTGSREGFSDGDAVGEDKSTLIRRVVLDTKSTQEHKVTVDIFRFREPKDIVVDHEDLADTIEFWEDRPGRQHVRTLFTRAGDGWGSSLLYP